MRKIYTKRSQQFALNPNSEYIATLIILQSMQHDAWEVDGEFGLATVQQECSRQSRHFLSIRLR